MIRFKFDRYLLIFSVISILFLASLIRYSLKSYHYPIWDEQYYMSMASTYFRLLQEPSLSKIYELITFQGVKQMGYPTLILPFLLIFGLKDSYFWALFTNGILYVATIFGVYFVAKNYLAKLSSFMAAVIFSCYTWVLFHLHFAYNETASSATIIWTIYFLTKSNLFKNRKYSVLFGLFFGYAIITRWVAPIFVAGPSIYIGVGFFKQKLYRKKSIILNLSLSILGILLITFIPYYVNRESVFSYFYGHRVGGEMWQTLPINEKGQFSMFALTFYLNSFNQLGTYFFILIIAGIILTLRKKSKLKLVLLAAFFPWVFFSFFSILKADRFIVPIYPYLAILSANVFDYIKNFKVRIALIILTLVLSVGTFLYVDWGKGPRIVSISRPPYIYKITGSEIIEYLEKEKISEITALYYYKGLSEPMMTYNLYHQSNPVNIVSYLGTTVTDPEESSKLLKTVLSSPYLLLKTGEKIDKSFPEENTKQLGALAKLFEEDLRLENYYEQKRRFWVYQDSSEAIIYRKKSRVSEEEYERLRLKLIDYLSNVLPREDSNLEP